MEDLRDILLEGDGDRAWAIIVEWIQQGRLVRLEAEISRAVVQDYWWTAGEWFEVGGILGLYPGHREDWDASDFLPHPRNNATRELSKFIKKLAAIPPSDTMHDLLLGVYSGVPEKGDEDLACARELHRLSDKYGSKLAIPLYGSIIDHFGFYSVGAARVFLDEAQNRDLLVGLIGLYLIRSRGLEKRSVRASMARLSRVGSNKLFCNVA